MSSGLPHRGRCPIFPKQSCSPSADDFLAGVAQKKIKIGSFRESYFPSEWSSIKDWFEQIRAEIDPDVVFTHCRDDRHQDHRGLSDLAWNTFRNHLILEYEIPK
jgi:LmbE family N-acetylglucosaminyl deacetylase